MKVCVYMEWDSAEVSGIGTSAKQQREALRRNGVEVTDDPSEDYDVLDVNTVGPRGLYHLKKAQRADKPAIVHAHTTAEDFRDSFRGSNLAAPVVKRIVKHYYNRADAVIVPSDHARKVVSDYPLKPPIHVVSNGVDLESLEGHEELREEYREKYDLDGMVVFAVGHVFERKGLSTFCKVAQDLPELDFVWFGKIMDNVLGSKKMKKWVNDPPENVQFTGFIEDIRGGFGAGDVFLFPTKEENQGIVVLEAMGCEKGVVVSQHRVFDEFLTDEEDCFKASEVDEYVDALETLRDKPELRKEMGEKARESAEEHSLDKVGKDLIEVYEEVAEY